MMAIDRGKVVVAWHNPEQLASFKREWRVTEDDPIIFQEDKHGEGCAVTKNKGIKKAYDSGAPVICVIDDDCYPENKNFYPCSIVTLLDAHIQALHPQFVRRVTPTTVPFSRGTPYRHLHMQMPVAASMGFWTGFPDYDALSSLQRGPNASVEFRKQVVFGEFFPFCGMNYAFKRDWVDCAFQIEGCNRWEDIFGGWVWEKIAYEKNHCFNLNGPVVRHSRQSNVWHNLREEVKYIEQNETLWECIAKAPYGLSADSLRKLCIEPILNKGGDKNG